MICHRIDTMGTDIDQVVGKHNHFHSSWMNWRMSVERHSLLLLWNTLILTTFGNMHFSVRVWRGKQPERTFLMLLMHSSMKMVQTGNPAPVSVLTQLRQWPATKKGSWHKFEIKTLKCSGPTVSYTEKHWHPRKWVLFCMTFWTTASK